MKSIVINNIIQISMNQKKASQKLIYLLKGLLFVFFIEKNSKRSSEEEALSSSSQAGDDIYPIF
jgi:hypothetical protein